MDRCPNRLLLEGLCLLALASSPARAGTTAEFLAAAALPGEAGPLPAEAARSLPGQGPLAGPAGAPGFKIARAIGGGLGLAACYAESEDIGAGAGLSFFGAGLLARDLLPGKRWPFPAVLWADAELAYFPADDGITDVIGAVHAGLGVDLLYLAPSLALFPYAGVGLGFESVSGRLSHGWWSEDVTETRLVFPFELGVGLAIRIGPRAAVLLRGGFSTPIGSANVNGYARLQGGLLVEF